MEVTTSAEALRWKRVAEGDSASMRAATVVNAAQASKTAMRESTRPSDGEDWQRSGSERRWHRPVPPGYWRRHAWKGGDGRNTGSPGGGVARANRQPARVGSGRSGWRRGP